jgi:hypothetical protein
MKLRDCGLIIVGMAVLVGLLIYGTGKAHAQEPQDPWLDLTLNTEDIMKPNAYPSMGVRINHVDEGFSASEILDSGLCVKVKGICLVNPVLYAGFSQKEVNNFPINAGIGVRSFLKIITVGYGYNTASGGDEARVMVDFVALGVAGYGAFGK